MRLNIKSIFFSLLRLILTILFIFILYDLFKYGIEKNIDINKEIIYTAISSLMPLIIFFLLLKELFLSIFIKDKSKNDFVYNYPVAKKLTLKRESLQERKIKAYHEAGHIIMANILKIDVLDASIEQIGSSGGRIIIDMPSIMQEDDIKNKVFIYYSGLISERLILKSASEGFMGSDESDFNNANTYLKNYLIIKDNELSLTGLDSILNEKIVELSKLWEQEVEDILKLHIEEIKEEAEKLLEKEKL